jgi:hypothetical protein
MPNGGGEAATREGVSRIEPARDVLDVKMELFDLIQPAGQETVNLALGAKPRHRLVDGAQREVRSGARRSRCPAPEKVVVKHPS